MGPSTRVRGTGDERDPRAMRLWVPFEAGPLSGFAAAAHRMEQAGLDGVEVHVAHTNLVGAFLSPLTNFREDGYGGPLENRLRLMREVLGAVRAATGPEFVVGVWIVGSEGIEGGIEPDEVARIRPALEDEGLVDFVGVSMGGCHNFGKMIGAPALLSRLPARDACLARTGHAVGGDAARSSTAAVPRRSRPTCSC